MRTVAPAKINWTLEVLGRRDDGYHEIRSVMQTIDLCDEVIVEEGGTRNEEGGGVWARSASLVVEGEHIATEDDLTLRAVSALEEATGRELPVKISLVKRVPIASGLGGGSSDAAAVLRLLDPLWRLGLGQERLAELAAGIGSDVAFFLTGGTALAEGRGEHITPLPDAAPVWLVLVVPPMKLPDKTERMYQQITAEEFSDGSLGDELSRRLRQGHAVREEDLHSAFEPVAYTMFKGLESYRESLLQVGAEAVHLAGAGPALFVLAKSEAAAMELANRVQASDAKVFVSRTLSAAEATAVVD